MQTSKQEVWLRGPVTGVIPELQGIVHALLQAREEVEELMVNFPSSLLWIRLGGLASPGFHLQHMRGVLDRLFTYARNEALSEQQFMQLKQEGINTHPALKTSDLLTLLFKQIDQAVDELKSVDHSILHESRRVGRAGLPSTVMGLFVHAAEHTMRHLGQLLVTAKLIIHQHTHLRKQ